MLRGLRVDAFHRALSIRVLLFVAAVGFALSPQSARSEGGAVIESKGNATYSIPILTPPGTAGTGPDLSLLYRSRNGKGPAGWLGFGWSLSGASAITRDLKHGVPFDYGAPSCGQTQIAHADETWQEPVFAEIPCYRDDFVFGQQDLLCAESPCTDLYKTQTDKGKHIRFLGPQLGWEVAARDGTVSSYGAHPATRIVSPKNGQVFSWLLDRVEDVHGNWIQYEYVQPPVMGVAYLFTISYAQADQGAANRKVAFILNDPVADPRPDRAIGYRAGFRQEVNRRLSSIQVRAAGDALVTEFELEYASAPDSGRSLLASVRRLGSDGADALPPHVFEYSESAHAFESATTAHLAPGSSLSTNSFDVPGCSLPPDRTFLDFNRDGLLDAYEMSSGPQTHVRFGNGEQFESDTGRLLLADSCRAALDGLARFDLGERSASIHEGLMDINGDGYPDSWNVWPLFEPASLLLGGPDGFIRPSTELDFDVISVQPNIAGVAELGGLAILKESDWYGVYSQNQSLVDMTGDGLPDQVISRHDDQQWVASQEVPFLPWFIIRNEGVTTSPQGGTALRFSGTPMRWNSPLGGAFEDGSTQRDFRASFDTAHLTRDLNGDGLPDQIWAERSRSRIWVAYNYGAGFDPPEIAVDVGIPFDTSNPDSITTLRRRIVSWKVIDLLDLNGDGFLDQVMAHNLWAVQNLSQEIRDSKWAVRLGTGSGFRTSVTLWDVPSLDGAPEDTFTQFRSINTFLGGTDAAGLADFNGDGLLDAFGHTTSVVSHHSGPIPDQLIYARNPHGGSIEFSYGSSAQMRDALGKPANPGLGPARSVVVQTTITDGRPGTPDIISEYHYENGVFDFDAREFRGFGMVTRLDRDEANPPGTETSSAYITDPACGGRLASREVLSGSGVVQVRESLDYLVVSGPDDATLDLSRTWSVCLPQTALEEAVEGNEAARRVRKIVLDYGPDPLASSYNVQRRREWGEVDPSDSALDLGSDGRITHFAYAQPTDPASPIVSRVSERWVTSLDGTLKLAHDRFYFDGLPLGQVAAGVLTKTEQWYEAPLAVPAVDDSWVSTLIASDSFGNPTLVTGPATRSDPDGFQSRTTFDSVYRTFPAAETRGSDLSFGGLTTTIDFSGCASGLEPPQGLGLPCVITRAGGLDTTRFGYDSLGRVVLVDMPARGLVENRTYDAPLPGQSAETKVTVQRWVGELAPLVFTQIRDGLGRTVRRDSPGKTSSAEVVRVVLTYDARGRLASETIPHFADTPTAPLVRSFTYGPLGRTREILDFDAQTRKLFSYSPWQVAEETYFGAATDVNRRERVERTVDGLGRVVKVSNFEDAADLARPFVVTAEYDEMDRLLHLDDSIANDPGLCTEFEMGSACAIQRHVTDFFYDSLGRRVRIRDPDTGAWRFQFDAAGLLEVRTDARGQKKLFSYDGLQRLRSAGFSQADPTFSPDASFSYQDDPAAPGFGRLASIDSPGLGTTYRYEYDAAGRVTALTQVGLTRSFRNEFSWDPVGRLATRVFPDGETYSYRYDGLRHVGIDGPVRVLLGAEYDALGRPTELEVGALDPLVASPVATLSYSYDPDTGRLQAMRGVATDVAGPPALAVDLEFDGLGLLVAQDGAYGASPLGRRSFEYDGLGRLARAEGPWEKFRGNGGSVSWDFEYDPLGNLRRQTSSNGSEGYERSWRYNDRFRPRVLTGFVDPVENQRVFTDSNGNTDEVDGEDVRFRRWNAQHRMRSETIFDGSSLVSTFFLYDFFGDRVLRTTDGGGFIYSVGGDFEYDEARSLATKFFAVGAQRVATRATSYSATRTGQQDWVWHWIGRPALYIAVLLGAVLVLLGLFGLGALALSRRPRVWITAPGVGLLSAVLVLLPSSLRAAAEAGAGPVPDGQHAEPLLIYLSDHLGSTRVVLDANGNTVETRDYAPFGQEISHTGAFALRNQFTGQPKIGQTGLHDYGARMYDARWGRFISADELAQSFDSQGLNSYGYALNRPTSLIDPDGRFAVTTALFVAATVAATGAVILSRDEEKGKAGRVAQAGLELTAAVAATGLFIAAPPAGVALKLLGAVAGGAAIGAASLDLREALESPGDAPLSGEVSRARAPFLPPPGGPPAPGTAPGGAGKARSIRIEVEPEGDQSNEVDAADPAGSVDDIGSINIQFWGFGGGFGL